MLSVPIGPYYCAEDNVLRALTVCEQDPALINVPELVSITHATEQTGTIDPVKEMWGDKVLLVSGTLDTVVRQGWYTS